MTRYILFKILVFTLTTAATTGGSDFDQNTRRSIILLKLSADKENKMNEQTNITIENIATESINNDNLPLELKKHDDKLDFDNRLTSDTPTDVPNDNIDDDCVLDNNNIADHNNIQLELEGATNIDDKLDKRISSDDKILNSINNFNTNADDSPAESVTERYDILNTVEQYKGKREKREGNIIELLKKFREKRDAESHQFGFNNVVEPNDAPYNNNVNNGLNNEVTTRSTIPGDDHPATNDTVPSQGYNSIYNFFVNKLIHSNGYNLTNNTVVNGFYSTHTVVVPTHNDGVRDNKHTDTSRPSSEYNEHNAINNKRTDTENGFDLNNGTTEHRNRHNGVPGRRNGYTGRGNDTVRRHNADYRVNNNRDNERLNLTRGRNNNGTIRRRNGHNDVNKEKNNDRDNRYEARGPTAAACIILCAGGGGGGGCPARHVRRGGYCLPDYTYYDAEDFNYENIEY